jgi:hypothetical protein
VRRESCGTGRSAGPGGHHEWMSPLLVTFAYLLHLLFSALNFTCSISKSQAPIVSLDCFNSMRGFGKEYNLPSHFSSLWQVIAWETCIGFESNSDLQSYKSKWPVSVNERRI